MKKVFFPGSFNPFTQGHADILTRLLAIADKVVVGIGINIDKPGDHENAEENAAAIRRYAEESGFAERVEVRVYSGLTGVEAIECGAQALARGVRNASDFEYESSLAALNRDAFGIETILLAADPALCYVSSTAIRDLRRHNRDDIAERYLPHPNKDNQK